MTKDEAVKAATEKVYIYMTRGDIEDECRARGIRVVKNRSTMEQKLIAAYTKEWSDEK